MITPTTLMQHRSRHDFVHKVQEINGVECSSPDAVASACFDFCKKLMGTSHPVQLLNLNWIANGATLSDECKRLLLTPVTHED